MCLAVPALVIEHGENEAVADLHGNRTRVSTLLVPDVAIGDRVLVHAGFAIQRIDAEAAARTWSVLADLQSKTGGEP